MAKATKPASTQSSAPTWKPNPTTPAEVSTQLFVIPNGAEGPMRNLLCASVENARVERTLPSASSGQALSAAFDLAFALELKAHVPLSATVEEQRFQRRVTRTQEEPGFSP